jgi:hypothetical protein
MDAVFAKELGAISHDASIPFEAIMETPAAAKSSEAIRRSSARVHVRAAV